MPRMGWDISITAFGPKDEAPLNGHCSDTGHWRHPCSWLDVGVQLRKAAVPCKLYNHRRADRTAAERTAAEKDAHRLTTLDKKQ